jgi:hypothetical protein
MESSDNRPTIGWNHPTGRAAEVNGGNGVPDGSLHTNAP